MESGSTTWLVATLRSMAVPGVSMSVRSPMYSGSIVDSASPVAAACTSERSRPARPRMAVTESCMPASDARRQPSICSATVMPLWMSASVCSSPDSRPR